MSDQDVNSPVAYTDVSDRAVDSAGEPVTPGSMTDSAAGSHEEPVMLMDAGTDEEAEIVRATLEAAGIQATLLNPNLSAGTGMFAQTVGDTWANPVYVSASDLEAARAILNAPPPTEAELTAEEEADPTTLEEAEAQVK